MMYFYHRVASTPIKRVCVYPGYAFVYDFNSIIGEKWIKSHNCFTNGHKYLYIGRIIHVIVWTKRANVDVECSGKISFSQVA